MGVEMDWERPTVILKIKPRLFPFKVDQFKSDIKIRNNQGKKNTAKGYSIYIQLIFLKTKYIFTEIKQNSEIISYVVSFYILTSSSLL